MGCVQTKPIDKSNIQACPANLKKKQQNVLTGTTQNQKNNNQFQSKQTPKSIIQYSQNEQKQLKVPQQVKRMRINKKNMIGKHSLITIQDNEVQRIFSQYQNSQIQQNQYQRNQNIQNLEQMLQGQDLQGAIRQQNNFSTIMIYNSKVHMEFSLPNNKAGPLVVPFINYDCYRI